MNLKNTQLLNISIEAQYLLFVSYNINGTEESPMYHQQLC